MTAEQTHRSPGPAPRLRREGGDSRHLLRHLPQRDLRHHRPGPVRQDLAAALHQPHHRFHRRRRASPARSRWTARTCGKVKNVYELRRKIGMVAPLPVGLPLSIYDNVAFAPRCAGHDRQERAGRHRRAMPAPGRAVGRGQGPPRQPRHQALRRPAAAPHHRPRPLAPARDPLPGRVLHRHRSRSPPCASRMCSRNCAGT